MFSLLRARPPDPKIPVSENNCVVLQSFLCPVLLSGPLCRNRGDTGWATGESTLAATWSGPWPWTPTASISFNLTEPIQLSAPPWERRPEASLRRWELRGEPPGPQSPPQGEARLGTSVCKARFSGETLELNYTGDSLGSSTRKVWERGYLADVNWNSHGEPGSRTSGDAPGCAVLEARGPRGPASRRRQSNLPESGKRRLPKRGPQQRVAPARQSRV